MIYSEEEKEKLIKQFLPRIKHHALKYYYLVQNFLELNDLISAGIKGLLEGLNKFNPSLKVPLSSFIEFRIRGAILDEIRSVDVFSKEYRKKIEDVKKAYKDLKQKGHEPTDQEIASKIDISEEELQKIYQSMHASNTISLDDYVLTNNGEKLSIINVISDETDIFEDVKMREIRDKIAIALEKLSKQEKYVIALYYYEDLNMREIANVLDLSLSRVSQIHGKALLKLRSLLETH